MKTFEILFSLNPCSQEPWLHFWLTFSEISRRLFSSNWPQKHCEAKCRGLWKSLESYWKVTGVPLQNILRALSFCLVKRKTFMLSFPFTKMSPRSSNSNHWNIRKLDQTYNYLHVYTFVQVCTHVRRFSEIVKIPASRHLWFVHSLGFSLQRRWSPSWEITLLLWIFDNTTSLPVPTS